MGHDRGHARTSVYPGAPELTWQLNLRAQSSISANPSLDLVARLDDLLSLTGLTTLRIFPYGDDPDLRRSSCDFADTKPGIGQRNGPIRVSEHTGSISDHDHAHT